MLEITLKVFGDWVNCRNYLSSFFSIGYRYELYCISKAAKTTQCTLHCDTNSEESWEWNFKRPESSQYSREVFDALVLRYEAPDSRNRWDSPLFTIHPDEELPFEHICGALFERKAPPPNQSTQSVSHSKKYCFKDFFYISAFFSYHWLQPISCMSSTVLHKKLWIVLSRPRKRAWSATQYQYPILKKRSFSRGATSYLNWREFGVSLLVTLKRTPWKTFLD